jgi:predicted nucleotidyltransferase
MKYGRENAVLEAIISELKKIPEIESATLYGSRAKGTFKPASDINIALSGPLLTVSQLNALSWAPDDLLLPYTFDLAILDQIKDHDILDHIARVGIPLY